MTTELAIAAVKAQALWDTAEALRRQAAELHPEFARMWANSQVAWSVDDWQIVKEAAKEARGEMGKGMAAAFRADFPWSAKLADRFAKVPTYCGATGTHSPTSACGAEMPCDEHAEED